MAQSPIFIKTEAFMLWLLQHTSRFPKHERFRLAKHIDDAVLEFHACLIRAARLRNSRDHLDQARVEFDKVQTYLRFSMELAYTSRDQFKYASEQLVEIGNLMGGWLKKASGDG
jgi:hypothetical protein